MTIRSRDSTRLEISGVVRVPRSWDASELAALETTDIATIATGFAGQAVRMAELLAASDPLPTADYCTIESGDGLYRASIPIADLTERGWLIVGRDGRPVGHEEGGPFRLVVEEGRTLCWNVKGVAELRLTMGREPDSIPENPPH